MITVGVDLAADPRKTALARIEWMQGHAEVTTLVVGVADDLIVEHAHAAAMVGIDSPLGWPTEFIDFVSAHRDGRDLGVDDTTPGWRSPLVNRRTDLACADYTKQQLGKAIRPLSVSADLLGHVAMRCAALQVRLLADGFVIDRSGTSGCLVEVYPAASLALWDIRLRSYKGPLGRDERERGLDELFAAAPWLRLDDEQADLCARVDHAFDAVVCALATAAVVTGAATAPPPAELARYRAEGWVRLPTIGLSELAASVAAARMDP